MLEREPTARRIGFDTNRNVEGGFLPPSQYDLAFKALLAGSFWPSLSDKFPEVFSQPIGNEFNLSEEQLSRLRRTRLEELNLGNLPSTQHVFRVLRQQPGPADEPRVETLADLVTQRTWDGILRQDHVGPKSVAVLREELTRYIEDTNYKKDPPQLTPAETRALEIIMELAGEDSEGQFRIRDLAERLGRGGAWAQVLVNNLRGKEIEVPQTKRRK